MVTSVWRMGADKSHKRNPAPDEPDQARAGAQENRLPAASVPKWVDSAASIANWLTAVEW
jgi:hypothetical protein